MINKICFEGFDRSFKFYVSNQNSESQPFGGKIVVFGGDFRQMLPVIPKGTR